MLPAPDQLSIACSYTNRIMWEAQCAPITADAIRIDLSVTALQRYKRRYKVGGATRDRTCYLSDQVLVRERFRGCPRTDNLDVGYDFYQNIPIYSYFYVILSYIYMQ